MITSAFQQTLEAVREFGSTAANLTALQEFTVQQITERLPWYHWTGFYMLDPQDANTLVLGPFRGAPTEHTRIPVSEGICGAAVSQGQTVIVDDVSSDPRYLACSLETRSEIVVPIRVHGTIAGEIDIDSHDLAAFGPGDRAFLEECAQIIGAFLENTLSPAQ
jgi:L-methionine (R)-S-oxide reductase